MTSRDNFWQGKKCLVTGGVGFIGSHLCRRLHALGARVFSIDSEECRAGTLFPILNRGDDITVVHDDLSNPKSVGVVQDISPDFIFHLAGSPYAPFTTRHPQKAYLSNVVSTVNMLEGARLADVKKFILASSACVFGAAQHSPLLTTDAPYVPEHYYSITKQDAERQVNAFGRWYGIEAAICRFGNIYGPGDRHFGRIVPQICNQLIKEKRETLLLKRSSGDSVFEFLYVDDCVKAFLATGESQSDQVETLQFSGGERARVSILSLAEMISRKFDGEQRAITVNSATPEKTVEKYLDVTATEQLLGWAAGWDLEQGLEATVEWYKANINHLTPHEDL